MLAVLIIIVIGTIVICLHSKKNETPKKMSENKENEEDSLMFTDLSDSDDSMRF
ncbi:MAG: hypothetical protein IJS88_06000 [Alphaproteobacteria bacterium]|nr:hypothetical protein [Alphaproteobacteria bacterium]